MCWGPPVEARGGGPNVLVSKLDGGVVDVLLHAARSWAPLTIMSVWISDWEVGCCRDVPRPGEAWTALLALEGTPAPASDEQFVPNEDGSVAVAGQVVHHTGPPHNAAILRAGPVHVVVFDAPGDPVLGAAGRLYEDNHFDYVSEAEAERWSAAGTVRRLFVVRKVLAADPATGVRTVVDEEPPHEVELIDPHWVGAEHWDALVEVEIGSAHAVAASAAPHAL